MNSTHNGRRGFRLALTAVAIAATATIGLTACSGGATDSADDETLHVGVFLVAQASLLDDIEAAFETAVKEGLGDTKVEFDVKNANGDQSLITSIARDLASSDNDAFAVLGTPAVIALAEQVKDRPIFALAMGDPVGAGLAESLEEPGGNVTGSIDYVEPALLLEDILAIQPDLKTIGTVYDPSNQNMQVWTKALDAAAKDAGIDVAEATISGAADVAQSARSLDGRADAILIGPDATVIAGIDAVTSVAIGGKIPLYVSGGDASVAGVLASIGPNYPELGTIAGQSAAKVLLGADPATTPFAVPTGLDLVINGTTQDTLGITIPKELLDRATVL
ncbi:ABC transporter substrate-binding protein [soil metagenome]